MLNIVIRIFVCLCACVCMCVSWRYLKPNHFCWHVYKSRFYQLHLSMGGGMIICQMHWLWPALPLSYFHLSDLWKYIWNSFRCHRNLIYSSITLRKKNWIPDWLLATQTNVSFWAKSEMLVSHSSLILERGCTFVSLFVWLFWHTHVCTCIIQNARQMTEFKVVSLNFKHLHIS